MHWWYKFQYNLHKVATGLVEGQELAIRTPENNRLLMSCVDMMPYHGNDCVFCSPLCLYKSIYACWIKELIHKEVQSQAIILPFAISNEPGCFVSENTCINFWLVTLFSYAARCTDFIVMMLLLIFFIKRYKRNSVTKPRLCLHFKCCCWSAGKITERHDDITGFTWSFYL